MAHILERKAKALLMTGHSVKETAEACGVPKQTVSRWKHKDLPQLLQPIVASSPELRTLARWGRQLRAVEQNGTKKEPDKT